MSKTGESSTRKSKRSTAGKPPSRFNHSKYSEDNSIKIKEIELKKLEELQRIAELENAVTMEKLKAQAEIVNLRASIETEKLQRTCSNTSYASSLNSKNVDGDKGEETQFPRSSISSIQSISIDESSYAASNFIEVKGRYLKCCHWSLEDMEDPDGEHLLDNIIVKDNETHTQMKKTRISHKRTLKTIPEQTEGEPQTLLATEGDVRRESSRLLESVNQRISGDLENQTLSVEIHIEKSDGSKLNIFLDPEGNSTITT